jgi:CubicO group peptidase (beta-lactamase class C family)
MDAFVAYHGVDAMTHQARFDELSGQGWRIAWLNVSGPPAAARYAAVWIVNDGRAWAGVHNVDAGDYQRRFDELTSQGLVPSLVSASGPPNEAVFAAVFEQRNVGGWFARHGLRFDPDTDPDTLAHENNRAHDQGFIPRCLAVYGVGGDRRFAGVWWQNPGAVQWAWWLTDPDMYQRVFDAELGGGLRPASLSVGDDHWLLSVFRNDQIGPWVARHNITAPQYQEDFDRNLDEQRRPIVVAAGGQDDEARYAAVFAGTEVPTAREWTVTGQSSAAGPALDQQLDDAMGDVMHTHGVRAGALAVARGGVLRVARGYTWAEPGFALTQPGSTFRVASLSKIFTTAAAQALADDGVLPLDTPIFTYLGVSRTLPAGLTPDPRIGEVTIQHVLTRASGIVRNFGFTPDNPPRERTFRDVSLAAGRSGAPTLDDVVRYVYGLQLRCDPGTVAVEDNGYSNSAFHVLTAVVQQAAARPIDDYIRARLLAPFAVGDVYTASTTAGGQGPAEVPEYDAPGASPSMLDLTQGVFAPDAYGGQVLLEVAPGTGGFATSATTIARFIGSHAVWDAGGRVVNTRYGDFPGTGSGAYSRWDGLDVAFAFSYWVSDIAKDALIATIDPILDAFAAAL